MATPTYLANLDRTDREGWATKIIQDALEDISRMDIRELLEQYLEDDGLELTHDNFMELAEQVTKLIRAAHFTVNFDPMTPGMPDPCQPIGCNNGIHRPGCVFIEVDEETIKTNREMRKLQLEAPMTDGKGLFDDVDSPDWT